jgi:hypothetical protein
MNQGRYYYVPTSSLVLNQLYSSFQGIRFAGAIGQYHQRAARNPMKTSFLVIAIFCLLVLVAPDVSAEGSDADSNPFWDTHEEYLQYQDGLEWQQYLEHLEQTDPYDFPVMHYRLYRKPEPFAYQPCCIPTWRGFGWSSHWTMNGGPTRRTPESPKGK